MIRFAIKNTAGKAEKEGDTIVRYSGVSEPFYRISERQSTQIGIDEKGDPRLIFTTGLDPEKVDFYQWYNEAEKAAVKEQIENLKPLIEKFYGGPDVVKETNKYFWARTREISHLRLTNEDIDLFFDCKNPAHALLYLSIISGAFSELVAPTKEWADNHQIPHYLVLETEDVFEDEDEITRSDAHGALTELRKEQSNEALFILAWCMQYDTNGYGAYSLATPVKDLITYHIKYIDGKIVTKAKRNTPKVFMDYYEKWKGQQTKQDLYLEAYVKAGDYYSFLTQREKKFTMPDGTILGSTVDEAVKNLKKPKFSKDFEALRDFVEAKWKE